MNDDENTWAAYRNMIMTDLERLNTTVDTLREKIHEQFISFECKIHKIELDINTLTTKLGVISAVAGIIGGLVPVLFSYFILGKK